ncbi:MAG: translocation/assembly module TamB domain-containing protein, partial [Planctomycetota bacterium]|nr:translocation/assembly module TamB domain-containing protein [Planctomycetota bacterium]
EGTLLVREGKVDAHLNLVKGLGRIDVDGTIPLDEELKGDFDISGHAQGPLDGNKEEWTFSDVRITSRDFSFQKISFEEIDILVARGNLENLIWKGNVKRQKDRLTAAGTFRWGDQPVVQSILKVNVESLTPYRALLPELDSIEVAHLEVKGNFLYDEEGPSFDGDIHSKEGRAFAFYWNKLRSTGQVDRNSINLEGVTLTGTPIAHQIDASGLFRADGSFSGYVRTDEDQIDLAGHISRTKGVEVEYLLEGPMRWLELFKINIPQEARPFYFQGIASGNQNQVHIRTALVAGDLVSATPQLVISRNESLWNLDLSQGSILLQGKEQIRYGKGQVQIRPGYLSLSEVPLTIEEPDLEATVWGQAEWNEEKFQTDLHFREVRGWGSNLGTVRAFGGFQKESENLQVNLNWGELSGDHLMAAGVFGKSNDFTLDLRIRDLDNSALRQLLPGIPLEGEVALQVDVRQEGEEIIAKGEGTLDTVSILGSFPLSMKIPITSGSRAVAIPETEIETPYGKLKVGGKIPLPWSTYAGDLNLSAHLEVPNFEPIFRHFPLPEDMEEPQGEATLQANVRGSILKPEARLQGEIRSDRSPLPPPLGELSNVHLKILYDGSRFQLVDGSGKMGGGPFHLSGEWITSEPNQPLRVRLRGEEILAVQEKLARIRIDPDIELRWNSEEGCKITGDVELPFGLYFHEFGPKSDIVPVRTAEAVLAGVRLPFSPDGGLTIPGIKGFGAIALDLNAKTTGECRIENSEIGILIDGDVRMRGTMEKPALSGTITSKQGEFKLSSGIFLNINSARVDLPFVANEDGNIQFKGDIGQGEGRISVILNGPISLPRLNLQSYPPRPQQELLARVAFGQAPGALSGTGALGTLAVKVLEQISDDWPEADPEESLLGRLKLSIVDEETLSHRISPWELPPIGTVQGTRVKTEYLLNSFLSVIAETDEDGNVSGDLKVRWNFR